MNSLRFLMFLVGGYYFLQATGGNPGLHFQSLQKYLKEVLGFSPTEMSVFMALLVLPWTIKPLYGIISDFFPIFGSRRKSYFILTGLLGASAYLALSWSGFSQNAIMVYLIIAAIGFAFSDVLCDAVMVEKGQPLKATDRLQSVQWAASGLAGIIIAYSKGYIAERWTFQQALWLTAIPPLMVVAFTLFALKEDSVQSSREAAKQAWSGLRLAVKSKFIWLTALFLFLFNCNPNLGSVFYYYEKDILKFSDLQIGKIDMVGSIGLIIGVMFYGLLSKRISHQMLLRIIIITGILGNISYLFLRDILSGYIVSGFSGIVLGIAMLGLLTLAAKACPKHVEASVFALLMSVYNLGIRFGDYTGSYIYEHVGKLNLPVTPYSFLVIIATLFTACMWFFKKMAKEAEN